MRRSWRVIVLLIVGVVGIAAGAILFVLIEGPMLFFPPAGVMYPRAPAMPSAVRETAEDLLARLERLLRDRAPDVLTSLQRGLNDAQIDALQSKHGFVLPPDLRALYRWRNGALRGSRLDVFADHWFSPLDEALAARDVLRRQIQASTPVQQQAHAAYAGHRDGWLDVIVDLAGDGYFFDPGRSEAEGSFFFCFAEDGSYVFFPAFRNFLAGTIEGHESGVLTFGSHGAETADFVKAREIWRRYGAENPLDEEVEP